MPPADASATLLPEWISAISTAAGVLLALVALIVTFRQVWLTAGQIRDTARQEARNSEDRTRPYLSLDIVPSLAGKPAIDLVVSNPGRSTARNIKVGVDGHDFGPLSDRDKIGPALGRLFEHGFDLAPGTRRRFFWHFPASPSSSPSGEHGAPSRGSLRATYGWQAGDDRPERAFEERIDYNAEDLMILAPIPWTGPKASSDAEDESVQNIVHSLRALAQNVGESNR